MLISYNLLKMLQPNLAGCTQVEITNALMHIGIEVEATYTHDGSPSLMYGRIINLYKHEQSTKLHVCQVELSNQKLVTIVCGANNVYLNQRVVVAPIGCQLPNGLIITERELLGVKSQGMICAYQEIAHWTFPHWNQVVENSGIIDLGTEFNYYAPFDPSLFNLDDVVYDLSIPANRADLYCAWGIVVELSQKLNLAFAMLELDQLQQRVRQQLVSLATEQLSLSYPNQFRFGLMLNIDAKAPLILSWQWKSLLYHHNFQARDYFSALNYLSQLLYLQPINYFAPSAFGTSQQFRWTTNSKSGQLQLVNTTNQVISPHSTKDILSGSSYYCQLVNYDPNLFSSEFVTNYCHKNRAIYLSLLAINHLCTWFQAAHIEWQVLTYHLQPTPLVPIVASHQQINALLGAQLANSELDQALMKLGFHIENEKYYAPIHRLDVTNLPDLAEEVINIADINKLVPQAPTMQWNEHFDADAFLVWQQARTFWLNLNFVETKTYQLQSENVRKQFSLPHESDLAKSFHVTNFHKVHHVYLRSHGLSELMGVLLANLNNQNDYQRYFELIPIQTAINQTTWTLNVLVPQTQSANWNHSNIQANYHDLLAWMLELFAQWNIHLTYQPLSARASELFVSENTIELTNQQTGALVGYLGQLHYDFVNELGGEVSVAYLGLFAYLPQQISPTNIQVPVISTYPSAYHDYSWSIDASVAVGPLLAAIKQLSLVSAVVIKEQRTISETQITYLIRVRFHSDEHTLSALEIQQVDQDIQQMIIKFGGQLR